MRRALITLATLGGFLASPSLALAQSPATQASVASIILQNLPTNGQQQITANNVRNIANALNAAIFQNNVTQSFLIGTVNLNLIADTPFSFFLPNGLPNYTAVAVRLYNCSASASSASVAVYAGPGATGAAIVPITAVTITGVGPNVAANTQSIGGAIYSNSTTLYFRPTTPEGAPVTCSATFSLTPQP